MQILNGIFYKIINPNKGKTRGGNLKNIGLHGNCMLKIQDSHIRHKNGVQ